MIKITPESSVINRLILLLVAIITCVIGIAYFVAVLEGSEVFNGFEIVFLTVAYPYLTIVVYRIAKEDE